jgi:hypothetical protein
VSVDEGEQPAGRPFRRPRPRRPPRVRAGGHAEEHHAEGEGVGVEGVVVAFFYASRAPCSPPCRSAPCESC